MKTGIQVQEAQRISLKINKNRSTPRHILVKFAKYREKEVILKAARNRRSLTYKGGHARLAADLTRETWQAREKWHDIFNMLNEKSVQPNIQYPASLSFR